MRILIVEDDPVLADGLTRSLKAAEYAVDCLSDGAEADHVLAAQSYDLVILDLGLPGLDGLEVLRRLRRRGASAPVLVLTARDALPERVKGLDLGADDYMTKPFDPEELVAKVRWLLQSSRESLDERREAELQKAELLDRLEAAFNRSRQNAAGGGTALLARR